MVLAIEMNDPWGVLNAFSDRIVRTSAPVLKGAAKTIRTAVAEDFLREPPNDIPAFSTAVLSDKEAADIWAWLHALPGRRPAKDFPLLNQ